MVTRATCRPAKAARLARQRMIARACLAGALLLAGCGKTEPPAPRAQAASEANRPAMAPVAASPASAASAALGPPSLQVATQGETRRADAAMLERGRYLATAADCAACHDGANHQPLAGGLAVNSPFGPIYAPNITPDPVHGIGSYTYRQFDDALRRGIRADGARLYPAMPYASYARLDDSDTEALYAYLMRGVAPSANAAPATRLPFPFNQRWGLAIWSLLFGNTQRFVPSPAQSAQWNRGAYLVQGAGHCGACHTPRGPAYNERGYDQTSPAFLTGGLNDNWFAPNLTGEEVDGLGRWSADDIAAFLGTGHARGAAVFGAMAPAVSESTSRLSEDDRHAIAIYLKSLPARATAAANPLAIGTPRATRAGPAPRGGQLAPGAGLYAGFCARCHGADGKGVAGHGPALDGNPIVVAANATSTIRIVVEGSTAPPATQASADSTTSAGSTASPAAATSTASPAAAAGSMPAMPAMGRELNAAEIADVVSYLRGAWSNRAAPVSTHEVRTLREAIHH
ncbi:cytochrome c [Burkholderia gladioli]|uniref:c-type cytochrome n=1 Tax=Burkholderia gladioli TaxID=28095 RepID=UPI002FE3C3ED